MRFLSNNKKILHGKGIYFFVSIFAFATLSILTFLSQEVSAASETISCNDVGSRTLTVGTYTDSDGTQFSDGADLTLNVGTSSSCVFVLNLLGTESAINLNSLTISSGVTLTHDYAITGDGTYYKIDLNIATFLTVETGASINVSEKGLLGTGSGSGYGFSPDGTSMSVAYGSGAYNGGSHGGSGGRNASYSSVGNVYDSISNPRLPGASGGNFAAGGLGGGVVRVTAASSTINGSIIADARDYLFSASGAGGTVYLNVTTEILGNGSITANGGAGASGYGAGGGGRIALLYTTLSGSITLEAFGGNSAASASDGGAGTIFKKPSNQTYGDLILDNSTAADTYYATQLPYPLYSDDSVVLYGGAYIFNSITLSNYAVLEFSSYVDPNGTGLSSGQRKIYTVNTASCSADYNDTLLSNGQIQYNIGYVADASSYQSNYVCVAPEFVIGLSSTTSTAIESVSSGSFEVALPAPYGSDITLDYAVFAASSTAIGAGTDYTLANGTLTVTAGDTTNTVSFLITDDADPEGSEDFVFELSNPSFGVIGTASRFTYTITDNDTPGVTADLGTGLSVSEGSDFSDTYSLVLNSVPTADVVITPNVDGELTISPSTLTFTSSSWATPQTLSVLAVDDAYAEGTHSGAISYAVSSTDLGYEGLPVSSETVSINDNDFAGVTVSASGGSTIISENGATDTYTLVLRTIPTADVVIAITPDAQSTVSTSSIIFTSSTWNIAQTITITAVNDTDVEGAHSSSLTHSVTSDDSEYNAIFVMGLFPSVIDNDAAAVTVAVSGASTAVREGLTTDTYTINLETQPTGDVVVTTSINAEVSISPSSLTFTSENWLTPQTFTITAVDDEDFEGSDSITVYHSASSSDSDYNTISIDSLSVGIYDNDGFTVTHSGGTTEATEGGATDSFTVVPIENPFGNITLTLTTSTEYTLSTTTLYFSMMAWNTPQEIVVTAVDDIDIEGPETVFVSSSISTFGFKYSNTILSPISVTIIDNDASTPGVTITESDAATNVVEGADTDTYTIVLDTEPTGNVTVSIASGAQSTVSTSSIVFTAANWDTAQTITVTAVDDFVVEGSHTSAITHSAVSSDDDYDAIAISSVTANITDNDSPSFVLNGFAFDTTEGGASVVAGIKLGAEPTENVYIPVSSSDTTEGTVSTSSITFTSVDWDSFHFVTITPVDDLIVDGDIDYSLVFGAATSEDSNWDGPGINPADPTVTNADNDTAGVTITESAASTDVTEGGATDSYTIVLNTQPASSVTISIDPDVQASVSTSSIIFTTVNWNTPQTVTVTADNDNIDEGAHTSTLSHTASSADGNYDEIVISDLTVDITDNDTAGITTSAISENTTEDEGTATFTVVLTSRPIDIVNIPVSSSDATEGTVSTSSLRFNPGNWNTARTVTVTGVNDNIDDGNIVYSIVVGAATSDTDSNYDGLSGENVSVTNTDNDTAGVTVTQSGGTTTLTEGGATDTYTLFLDTQPTASVTLTLAADAQSTISTSSIVFTTGNWNVAQTITVTSVNDQVAEGEHTSTITHTAASADSSYNGVGIGSVTANITDNDTAGFTVSAISGNTTEAGGTATFTVVLTSQPTGIVTTTVHSSNTAEGSINTSTLVFNAASWNIARTVTVTGENDSVDDGDVAYSIILDTATSTDGFYEGVNPANVAVTNTDNDTAGFTVSAISGNTTEAGGTATFTVVLTSEPTGIVTTTVYSSDTTEGTLTTSTLVFNAASWNLARTITVTGVNDDVDDGNISYNIILDTATSTDGNYEGINPANVSVVNLNDDVAGVTFAESGGATVVVEGGATDSYTLVLDSEPTVDVIVDIEVDANTTLSLDSLTFTSENWDTPQVVTVTAVDDADVNGTHSSTHTYTVTSDDTDYDEMVLSDLSVSITDNDGAEEDTPFVSHDSSDENSDESSSTGDSSPISVDKNSPVGVENSGIPYSEQTIALENTNPQKIKVGNEAHHVTRVSATDDSATIIIQSTPIRVTVLKHETKEVDTNGDNRTDISVTYNGLVDGVPQFTFQDITISSENRFIVINDNVAFSTSTQVLLVFDVTSTSHIAISNTSSFAGVYFQAYRKTLFWDLSPGNGNKTVYVRFQKNNGSFFDASDSIALYTLQPSVENRPSSSPAVSICEQAIGKPFQVKDSPAVYLVDIAHDNQGKINLNIPCAKRVFSNPMMYFSYFDSWEDIQMVTTAQINAIPNDEFSFIPFGPRYTPAEGTLLKTLDDSKVYIFLGAQKHWIEKEVVFRAAGYLFDWVKVVVNSLVENIPTGNTITTETQIPAQFQGKNVHEDSGSQTLSPSRFVFTQFLSVGSTGTEVEQLQQVLQRLGYFASEPTGYFGPVTANAVKAFQRDNNIDQRGYVGPGTRSVLNIL